MKPNLTLPLAVATYVADVQADGATLFRDVDEGWLALYGVTREQFLTHPELAIDAIHPDHRPGFLDANRQAWATRAPFHWEGRLQVRDQEIWVAIESAPFQADDGRIRFQGVMIDITARRQAERNLNANRESLEKTAYEVTEAIPVGTYVTIVQRDGRPHFPFVSTRWLEISGLSRKDFEANPALAIEVIHPEDRDSMIARNLEATASVTPFAWEGRLLVQGVTKWVSIESNPRRTPDGRLIWEGVMIDITARKQAEARLLEETERVRRLEQAKSAFLANMSHEIRTPLTSLLGVVQLLQRETLTPAQRGMVRRMGDAGQLLLGIVNDILDLSKIEAGRLSIAQQAFDPVAIIHQVAGLQRILAEQKGLWLQVSALSALPGALIGDPLRLAQVLTNLLSNAIKYTDQGGVTLTVQRVDDAADQCRLLFEVVDTGRGVDSNTEAMLFQAFSQGLGEQGCAHSGTGLGLAISKQLVEMMGGQIGVTPATTPPGSRFWFRLDLALATECPSSEMPAASPSPQTHRALQVLVVDDDKMIRDVIVDLLALFDIQARAASDGADGMSILESSPRAFDVVLMDVQMPGLNGIDATRRIRAHPELADLPVIALTAGVMADEAQRIRAAGVDALLAKPFMVEDLVDCLRRVARTD